MTKIKLAAKNAPPDIGIRKQGQQQVASIQAALNRLSDQDGALVAISEKLYNRLEDNVVAANQLNEICGALRNSMHEHKIALSVMGTKVDRLNQTLEKLIDVVEKDAGHEIANT